MCKGIRSGSLVVFSFLTIVVFVGLGVTLFASIGFLIAFAGDKDVTLMILGLRLGDSGK